MTSRTTICAALTAALLTCTSAMASTVVYSNNFSGGGGTEWSNSTTATDNGEAFLGDTNGFGNGTDTLSLSGLASHTQVTVSFDLYIIQSWDGDGPQGGNSPSNPDAFQFAENSNSLFSASFANYTSGNTQSFGGGSPGAYITTGSFAPRTGESDAGHLGFGTGDFGDATYHFSFTFNDANAALALAFISTQDQSPGDEGWGLDNVVVSTNADTTTTAVPLPATVWGGGLMLAALAAGTKLRRRFLA